MKALTIWQPWASLIAMGAKRYETRGWDTNYRGLLAIHAAARWGRELRDVALREPFRSTLGQRFDRVGDLPRSAVLCICRLKEVRPTEDLSRSVTPRELMFGQWGPGRFAWQLEVVRVFDEPIAARGFQGLWNWEPLRQHLPSDSRCRDGECGRRSRLCQLERCVHK